MSSVLTVFIDGLKPESLKHMPFLNSMSHQAPIRTELGYSIACHASMYSGVHPNKHLLWFVWQYSPKTSPFRWLRPIRNIRLFDSLPFHYFFSKTAGLFTSNSSWFGIPLVVNLPMQYWPYFDVSEKKMWNEPDYLQSFPTIFDILRSNDLDFEVVGMVKGIGDESQAVAAHAFSRILPWHYLFIGDVDHFSHRIGQDSPEAREKLARLDQIIEEKYHSLEEMTNGDFTFFCFSDHGHIPVGNYADIYEWFDQSGSSLSRYMHIVDANYARFWFHSDREQRDVVDILSRFDEYGFILSDEMLEKYHTRMPDNRYGDLIFYLDKPNVFAKTVWGFSRKQKSMHGYLPDHDGSDGIFASNRAIEDVDSIHLVDILPSILTLVSIDIPEYVDGTSVWAD